IQLLLLFLNVNIVNMKTQYMRYYEVDDRILAFVQHSFKLVNSPYFLRKHILFSSIYSTDRGREMRHEMGSGLGEWEIIGCSRCHVVCFHLNVLVFHRECDCPCHLVRFGHFANWSDRS
ncbi:hypothetical protein LOAG_07486, partial [Loa loa]